MAEIYPPSKRAKAREGIRPEVLISWRERMGYSQREASEALDCSRAALRHWEQGTNRIPRYIGLACAALALGMTAYGGKK
jgi:transcriptional regulator with XRE-family HTH domain